MLAYLDEIDCFFPLLLPIQNFAFEGLEMEKLRHVCGENREYISGIK
jgi:hypothetical protein